MKKITTLLVALIVAFSFTSCKDQSLQSYLVESQEKSGFITFDVPASILQIKNDVVSDATKAALNSIKKINVVALPYKDNADALVVEKTQLDNVFKGKQYKSIMRFNHENMKIGMYYSGEEDAINEVILFGYGAKQGVGIARLLGEGMNPAAIAKMMGEISFNPEAVDLEKFMLLMK
ncbi:MAG: DUF4252 domain-containing protein [Polaribacter sp.]|nr:DUF4252 domain-containing protein [Polaribacter sp.]MDG1811983.1 DUF4252 domain-containing protein [Polaribacter sp.]MDG1994348.1 DUF4252 domain-containing protein [Polaribacter sp.]